MVESCVFVFLFKGMVTQFLFPVFRNSQIYSIPPYHYEIFDFGIIGNFLIDILSGYFARGNILL